MAQSKFYIEPAGLNLGANLAGLGEIIAAGREKKKQEEEQKRKAEELQKAQDEIKAAIQSGDPASIADVSIQYPAFRESIESSMQIGADIRDRYKSDEKDYLQAILTAPANVANVTRQRIAALQDAGMDATSEMEFLAGIERDGPDEELKAAEVKYSLMYPEEFKTWKEATTTAEPDNTEAFKTLDQRAVASGLVPGTPGYQEFMRFGGGANVPAAVAPAAAVPAAPPALLAGLDADTSARASAAYTAAGGGKPGVDALLQQVSMGADASLRAEVPALLDQSYPNTSPAERAQLEAAVAGAKTVEQGLEAASKVRAEQRRMKKAQGFQDRAIELITSIVNHGELNAVVGGYEGRKESSWFDQEENDLIADIREAQNILTADNMDLMTGVLSESDLILLKNLSSGALDRTRSLNRFKKDAQRLLDKLGSVQVQTVDDLASDLTPEEKAEKRRLQMELGRQ